MNSPKVALRKAAMVQKGQSRIEKWLLQQIFFQIGPVPVRLMMQDGMMFSPPGTTPVATIVIRNRATLFRLLIDPEMGFGEEYAQGNIEVLGDLAETLEAIYSCWQDSILDNGFYQHLLSKWMNWVQDNNLRGSRRNIHRHYDLGNDFYRLWLDSQLVYTCAYFPSPSVSLEAAQEAKLDYICRKLRLRAGESVVEAGCGWGAFALHMAQHYGVSVRAFNISREQIAYARRQAKERGLDKQVEFIEDDYRNISGAYDVFVSVGMLEHVGATHFGEFGNIIHRAVGDRGRGLLHFIGRSRKSDFSRWIRRRIFPGAYAPALGEVLGILEPHNYAVLDVENIRLHYARTLEHWLERFESADRQVSAMFDEWFERAWRLYLAGSIAAFRVGALQLFQVSFAGAKSAPLAWTRAPLYADAQQNDEETKWTHAAS